MAIRIQHFFHSPTGTISYVVTDRATNKAIIIDPVADYDPTSNTIDYHSVQALQAYLFEHKLITAFILETHIHADHLTASFYLQQQLNAPAYISKNIKQVHKTWQQKLSLTKMYPFDDYLSEGDQLTFGQSTVNVLHTPGHTPSDLCYQIGNSIFVGDSLFFHGTARADFPGGSAKTMYQSLSRLYKLPDETQIYLCHNYPKEEAELIYTTSIGEEKIHNAFFSRGTSEEEFVARRNQRDSQLAEPKLITPALTYNLTAKLP